MVVQTQHRRIHINKTESSAAPKKAQLGIRCCQFGARYGNNLIVQELSYFVSQKLYNYRLIMAPGEEVDLLDGYGSPKIRLL